MNIIVTGASRGIGLELVSQALKEKNSVLAVVRDAKKSSEMQNLLKSYPEQLRVCETDVSHPEAGDKIRAAAASWNHVDLLINNAGVYKQGETQDDFLESFRVNTVAPFLITQALLPLLKKSHDPKAVHVTSKMGSIEDNTSGGAYAYRASKSALNMINMSLFRDNNWLSTIVIHPGWVKTDMGGSQAPTEIAESAAGIWKVAAQLKTENSGRFFDFKGENIPW